MQDNNDRDDLLDELFGDDYSYLINEIKNYGGTGSSDSDAGKDIQDWKTQDEGDSTRKFSDNEYEEFLSQQNPPERVHNDGVYDEDYDTVDDFDDDDGYTTKRMRRKRKNDDYDYSDDGDYEYDYRDDKDEYRSPIRHREGKRLGCMGGILYALLVICISIALGAVLWMAATDVLAFGKDSGEIEVTIPDRVMYETQEEVTDENGAVSTQTVTKANIDEVSQILREDGLIKYEKLFKLFCKVTHAEDKIKAGTYVLDTNYDYRAMVNGLRPSSGKLVETEVTIPEGYTLTQIFNLLEEEEVCSKDKLAEAAANYDFDYDFLDSSTLGQAKRLEGYMFPDTYKFYVNDEPERVINKMLSNFNNKFTDEYKQMASDMGYSVRDIIIIASMIEKEAGADSDRDLISSVIYNRLNDSSDFPYLQIDATIYYAIEDTGEAFSTEVVSPYNTYNTAGLPAGPISNPGDASIRAALQPQDTSYYYYALNKSGTHEFFRTYDGFLEFVNSEEYGG